MLLRNVDVEKLRFSSILYGAYRLPVFYMAIYITVCAVLAAGDKPPYGIPRGKCEPQATYIPKSYIFTKFPMENANSRASHFPKSSSFRNLSSNEVRYKFREREKFGLSPHKV